MTAFYVKSGSGVAEFAQSTAYSSGDRMVPKRSDTASNYLNGRKAVWECTTAGTTAAAEPTWPAGTVYDSTTVTSGTATFTARQPGYSSGTTADWTFATIYADYIHGTNMASAGDVVYISDAHNEAIGAAYSVGLNGVSYLCVDDATAPPTALSTGAIISTSGAFNLTLSSAASYFYGITFKCGIGNNATRALTGAANYLENCVLELATTGASSTIAGLTSAVWKDVRVKFAAAGQTVTTLPTLWSGGGLASGGTSPTNLLANTSSLFGTIENLDLSSANAAINICMATNTHRVTLRNIKMPASWSGAINASATPNNGASLEAFNVGEGALTTDYYKKKSEGTVSDESTIIVSGSPFSTAIATDGDAVYPARPLVGPELGRYNSSTSAITVTVDVLTDSATNLTDKDVILEVRYPSAADSPLGATATSDPGYFATAADLTASTAEWTTTGLTNPNKQKVSVTFTPGRVGYITATVKVTKASTTVYVDPNLQVA